jgi:hypothetical protein
MTGAIDPIRPIRLVRRETPRAETESHDDAGPVFNVSINVGVPAPEPPVASRQPPTNLDAHLIAQSARVRGLRGGQKVLETARHAYLETEWSGPNDRRTSTGRITKTEV